MTRESGGELTMCCETPQEKYACGLQEQAIAKMKSGLKPAEYRAALETMRERIGDEIESLDAPDDANGSEADDA